MSELSISPAGLLIAFFVVAVIAAVAVAALAWTSRRRALSDDEDGPVIDLTYLERAIEADEEAAARRLAQDRPLFSQSPAAQPDPDHQLPRDDR